jgi:hypothetical protein
MKRSALRFRVLVFSSVGLLMFSGRGMANSTIEANPTKDNLVATSLKLRLELDDLKRERAHYNMAMPSLVVAGGGTILFLGLVSELLARSGRDCPEHNPDCGTDKREVDSNGGVFAIIGLATIVGGVLLFKLNLKPFADLGRQIESKQGKLQLVDSELQKLGTSSAPATGLSLSLGY